MRLDRPACRRVLVLPGDADDGGGVRARSRRRRGTAWEAALGGEIAIGFVMAFIASALVVKPFLAVVRRVGFAPFAWYRIAAGVLLATALALHWI